MYPESMTSPSTPKRAVAGAGWLYFQRWIERLLEFLSIVLLARILLPEDFGLVAIPSSVVLIVNGLSDFDVEKALIRLREDHRSLYETAWTLSLLRGLVCALLMLGVAAFLTDSRIAALLQALALSPLMAGLSNPRFVTFERDLDYSKLAIQTLVAKILGVSVTLFLAVYTRSYWALVIGVLVGNLTLLVMGYVLRPYRPRLSLARFRDIFAFSGWMSMTTIVTTISMETDKIIVWRFLGVADAGLYYMTQRIGATPTRELISPLRRVLFPSFSGIVHDRDRLRRAVCESTNVLGSLSLPAAFGFALVANDFVPLALGERWSSIVPLLTVLVPYLGVRATLSMTQPCLMALGETRRLFLVSLLYACVHVPVFVCGTALYGLEGAIWSIVLAGSVYVYMNIWLLNRTLGIATVELLSQLRRPAAATLAMLGLVSLAGSLVPIDLFASDGSWHSLFFKLILGGVAYLAAQYAFWRFEGRPPGIEKRLSQLRYRG